MASGVPPHRDPSLYSRTDQSWGAWLLSPISIALESIGLTRTSSNFSREPISDGPPNVRKLEGWTDEEKDSLPSVLQSSILSRQPASLSNSTVSLSLISDSSCSNSQDSFFLQEGLQKKTDDAKALLFKIIQTNNQDLVEKALSCKACHPYKEEALDYSAQAGLARSFRELVKNMFNARKIKLQIDLLDLHTLGKAFLKVIPKRPVMAAEENERRFQIMKDFLTYVKSVIEDHQRAAVSFIEFRALVVSYVESGIVQVAVNNQSYLLRRFLALLSMDNTLQVEADYFTNIALCKTLDERHIQISIDLLFNGKNSFSRSVLDRAFYTAMGNIEKSGFEDLLEVLIKKHMISIDQRGFALKKIIKTTLANNNIDLVAKKNNAYLATLLLEEGCSPNHIAEAMNLVKQSTWPEMKTIILPYWNETASNRKQEPPQGYFSELGNYFAWLRSYLPL